MPEPTALAPHEPVRLVVIGAGRMAGEHIRTCQAAHGVDVVGVSSRSGSTAEALAAAHQVPHASADWADLVDRTRAHGIVVATSHLVTADITRAGLEQGLHVLAEKPVALEPQVVRDLHRTAVDAGVVAMVGMNRRFFRSVLAAQDIVRLHGPVVGIALHAPDPVRLQRSRGGYDESIYRYWTRANTLHAIDLLRVVAGDVAEVVGFAHQWTETSRVAALRFGSGILGTFASHGDTGGKWRLDVYGDGVDATLHPLEFGTVRIGDAVEELPHDDAGLKYGTQGQAEAFVHAIRTGVLVPPACDLEDHAASLDLAVQLEGLPGASEVGQH